MQDLAYDLIDTAGNFSFTYTIANIFLGNFILMNLALAGTYNPTPPHGSSYHRELSCTERSWWRRCKQTHGCDRLGVQVIAVIFESYQATKAVSQEKERRSHLERAALIAELAEQNRLEDEKRFIDEKVRVAVLCTACEADRAL